MLIEMEVHHLFDLMVISGKEGIEKPDPEIFQRALQRAGVEAKDSVYVGDHPRLDAEASSNVGMKSILIDRRNRHPHHEGTRIRTLEELPQILSS